MEDMDSHKSFSRMLVDSGEKFQFAFPQIYTSVSVGEEDTRRQPPIQRDEWIDGWLGGYNFHRFEIGEPVFPLSPSDISKIEKQSIDLKVSLQMLLHDATSFVEDWTDVNTRFKDGRSFRAFQALLGMSELDWHKYKYDDVSERVQEDDPSSIEDDLTSIAQPNHVVHTHQDWVVANKYYCRSLELIRLLLNISKSNSFTPSKQNQARLLMSFLGHLIMIQQEQRVVMKKISEQLNQLRCLAGRIETLTFDAISTRTVENRHSLDSLYNISRESTWLLKKLQDSPLASPSFIKESETIVGTLVEFIPQFKVSKETTNVILHFKHRIQRHLDEGVGKGTVIENLLGCLEHVCHVSVTGYVEAKGGIDFPWFSTLSGDSPLGCGQGSPLGCITLWRILFESSAAGLEKYYEAVELYVSTAESRVDVLSIVADIDLLVSRWEKVLLGGFLDMHKTVAMITYMLGFAFTTGGDAMKSLHDEVASQSKAPSQSKNDEEIVVVSDFPWDETKVRDFVSTKFDDPPIVSSFPMRGPCYGSCS